MALVAIEGAESGLWPKSTLKGTAPHIARSWRTWVFPPATLAHGLRRGHVTMRVRR